LEENLSKKISTTEEEKIWEKNCLNQDLDVASKEN
jgi:hypothetical protein